MTQSKKQLDELFGSVAHDTPSLERDELHSLLDKKISGTLPSGPLQTSITKDRKRGIITKGLLTMTTIALLLTAFFFFFNPSSATEEKKITRLMTPVSGLEESTAVSDPSSHKTVDPKPEIISKGNDPVVTYLNY